MEIQVDNSLPASRSRSTHQRTQRRPYSALSVVLVEVNVTAALVAEVVTARVIANKVAVAVAAASRVPVAMALADAVLATGMEMEVARRLAAGTLGSHRHS